MNQGSDAAQHRRYDAMIAPIRGAHEAESGRQLGEAERLRRLCK